MTNLAERCRELAMSAMKDGIADAAIEVLKQHGYEGLTMDRVAEAAGVAKGSIYNHFRGKQELVAYVFNRTIDPAMESTEEITQRDVPAVEKLKVMLRTWFEFFASRRELFDFLFHEPAVREICFTAVRALDDITLGRIAAIIRQGIAEGVFRQVDANSAAEHIRGAANFVFERQLETGTTRSIDECVRCLLDVFLLGLKVEAKTQT